MKYNIQELVDIINKKNVNRMIPILIGKNNSLYTEALTFTDINKTLLQLSNINNVLIDENSILVNIDSWNLKTSKFTITNAVSNTKEININLNLTEKLVNSSTFIIVNNNDEILFSSKVDKFIYNQLNLTKIILTNELNLTGSLDCYFINLENRKITGAFNSFTNIVTINTDFIFKTPSFNCIQNSSYITYVGSSRSYYIKYIEEITQNDIDEEKNPSIKAGLLLGSSAIIISYPNDSYIGEILEDLDKLELGYYIVPIDLESKNKLASYVKSTEKFYCLLTNTNIIETKIVSINSEFIRPDYVAQGYVAPGYYSF